MKKSPRWAIITSLALIILEGIFVLVYALISLKSLFSNFSYVLGLLLGQVIGFYFLIYIPGKIILTYLTNRSMQI